MAYGEVLPVLGLRPRYALFGHSHRAGPLPGDDRSEWLTPSGVELVNTGCWVNESVAFMSEEPVDNPYRPGFAVELDDDRPAAARQPAGLSNRGGALRASGGTPPGGKTVAQQRFCFPRHTRLGFRNR